MLLPSLYNRNNMKFLKVIAHSVFVKSNSDNQQNRGFKIDKAMACTPLKVISVTVLSFLFVVCNGLNNCLLRGRCSSEPYGTSYQETLGDCREKCLSLPQGLILNISQFEVFKHQNQSFYASFKRQQVFKSKILDLRQLCASFTRTLRRQGLVPCILDVGIQTKRQMWNG